jgi:hypothetical protein
MLDIRKDRGGVPSVYINEYLSGGSFVKEFERCLGALA